MIILDAHDKRILAFLKKKESYASLLSKELRLPRTSIAYKLERLATFHKVTKRTLGRKTLWRLTPKREHNKELFHVFHDDAFLECYKTLELLPPNSLIYAVQGKNAGHAALRHVPRYLTEDMHQLFKKRRIIMKAIANKKLLEAFDGLDEKMRASHRGRTQSIKLVDTLFTGNGEIFVTKEFMIGINPEQRRGIVVKEKELVSLFYDLMTLVFSLSERIEGFDLNRYLDPELNSFNS